MLDMRFSTTNSSVSLLKYSLSSLYHYFFYDIISDYFVDKFCIW